MLTPAKDNPVDDANATASQARPERDRDQSSKGSPPVPRVVVVCPGCKATLSVKRVYVGNTVRCKQCEHEFRVPAPADSQPQHADGGATLGQASHPQGVEVEAGRQRAGAGEKELLSQIGKLLGRNKELRSAYRQLEAQRDDLIANQDELAAKHKSELEAARAAHVPLNTQIGDLESELHAARERCDQLQAKHDVLITNQDELAAKHKSELEAARAEHVPLNAQVEELRSELHAARERCDQLQAEHDVVITNQDELAANHESKLAAARAEHVPLNAQIEELRSELHAARERCDQLQAEHDVMIAKQIDLSANHQSELAAAQPSLRR